MMKILIVLLLGAVPGSRAEADRLFEAGQWARARAAYEELLPEAETDSGRVELMNRIGRTHFLEGGYWDAETWFSRALAVEETAKTRLYRGMTFLYAGMGAAEDPTSLGAEVQSLMNDAARELERALELRPEWATVWLSLGYVERYRRDSEAEMRAFRRAHELDPEDPEAALQVAWFEERDGRPEQAREVLRKVPEARRTGAHWKALGRLAGAAGDGASARKAWGQAIRSAPDDQDAYLGLWEVTGVQKRFAEFNREMERVGGIHPDLWLPDYYLGFSLEYDGMPEQAVDAFLRAQEKAPEDEFRPLMVAADVTLEKLDREEAALDLYRELLRRDPGNSRAIEVLTVKAYDKAQAKDYEAAERLYGMLIEHEPGNWSHATNLALVYKETGRIDEAIARYRETAERHPFEPQILNDLGLLYMGLGRKEEGEAALREALERDPEFLDSLENLGAFARLEGRLDEALAFFRRAYDRVRREGGDASKFRRYLDMVAREREGLR